MTEFGILNPPSKNTFLLYQRIKGKKNVQGKGWGTRAFVVRLLKKLVSFSKKKDKYREDKADVNAGMGGGYKL